MWYYLYQIWKVAKHNQQTSKSDCEEEIFWTGNRLYGRGADCPDVAQPQDAGRRQRVKYGLCCWGFGKHSVFSIWASHRTALSELLPGGKQWLTRESITAIYVWLQNLIWKEIKLFAEQPALGDKAEEWLQTVFSFLLHLGQGSETHSLRSVIQSHAHYLPLGCFK